MNAPVVTPVTDPGVIATKAPSTHAMSRLVQAVRDLAAARDLDQVVEIVRHAARELVDADGATFVLRDEGQCYYVDEDAIQPLWRGQRFPLDACISGWSMLHNEQVVIPDIYLDDRIPHVAYRPTFVKSLVMTPIRTAEPVGSIGTYWASERVATPAERELLLALADSTSVAMESIRVLDELEGRVAERTLELEASNRDLAAFAHVAAHDLKAPLATITGYAELIADMDAASMSSEGTNALDTVRRQAARMAGLIDAVLSYSTASTTPLSVSTIDLNDVTDSVLSDLADLIASRGASVEVARPASCAGLGAAAGEGGAEPGGQRDQLRRPGGAASSDRGRGARRRGPRPGQRQRRRGRARLSASRSSTCSREATPASSRQGLASGWHSPDAWWRATAGRSWSLTAKAEARASRWCCPAACRPTGENTEALALIRSSAFANRRLQPVTHFRWHMALKRRA